MIKIGTKVFWKRPVHNVDHLVHAYSGWVVNSDETVAVVASPSIEFIPITELYLDEEYTRKVTDGKGN